MDDSLYTYQPLDFHVGLGYPAQAKLGLGAIVLIFVLVVALVWFVARLVRRRRAAQAAN